MLGASSFKLHDGGMTVAERVLGGQNLQNALAQQRGGAVAANAGVVEVANIPGTMGANGGANMAIRDIMGGMLQAQADARFDKV